MKTQHRDIEADGALGAEIAEVLRKADNLAYQRFIAGRGPSIPTDHPEVQAFSSFRHALDIAMAALFPLLAHPEAIKLLDIDRARWSDDGTPDIFNPWTAEGVAYELSTWLFDQVGRIQPVSAAGVMMPQEIFEWQAEVDRCERLVREHFSKGLADLAMKFWREGRHDT